MIIFKLDYLVQSIKIFRSQILRTFKLAETKSGELSKNSSLTTLTRCVSDWNRRVAMDNNTAPFRAAIKKIFILSKYHILTIWMQKFLLISSQKMSIIIQCPKKWTKKATAQMTIMITNRFHMGTSNNRLWSSTKRWLIDPLSCMRTEISRESSEKGKESPEIS